MRHPLDHPIADPNTAPSSPVPGQSRPPRRPKDGALPRAIPPAPSPTQRTYQKQVDAIAQRLSDRDLAILESVAAHRFLTIEQIQALHFQGHASRATAARAARRAAARLRSLRVLGELDRRVGGITAGSSPLAHYVDVVGARILASRSGHTSSHRLPPDPSTRFLDHCLAIADARIAVQSAIDTDPDVTITELAIEGAATRRYAGPGGAGQSLRPDMDLVTQTTEYEDAWFIEIDRGTESIPTLIKKCQQYVDYRASGQEQERTGFFPLVIWSMTATNPEQAARRRNSFAEAIERDPRLPSDLFRIVAPDDLPALILRGGDL